MSNWADELRALLVVNDIGATLEMQVTGLAAVGERQLAHALNTVECLVEANAALREQLCEFKSARRDSMIGRKEPGVVIQQPPQPPASSADSTATGPLLEALRAERGPKK